MILKGDYHTHTVYSDGNGTMEENIRSAMFKGLKQIAITEHGYDHLAHGIKRHEVAEYEKMFRTLKKNYKKHLDVLYGIEANILSLDGDIDLTADEQDKFDVIIVGFHKSYKPMSFKNFFNFWLPNNLPYFRTRKKQIEKNTRAYIKALEKNKIDILAHLNYGGCLVNCVEIAKKALETGTYIELNGKRILFTDQEIKDMVALGTKFIINSDAHYPHLVGKNNHAFNLVDRLNIPHEQIVNLNKLPHFKNYKQK